MKKIISLFFIFISAIFLVSCNNKYKYIEGKINITTTTNIMADLAETIGGEKVSVYSLMGAGVDPHQYVARPGDFKALDKADFILVSGLHLEGKMVDTIASYKNRSDKTVLLVGDEILKNSDKELVDRLIEDENFGGNFDPHFWFDIPLYKEAAKYLTIELANYSKESKEYFYQNYENYLKELDELDSYIRNEVDKLKDHKKFLISAHDAFEYFGKEYGFRVEALQGLSTEDEVSPSDVREIVELIIENDIKAIFPETSVPSETIMSVKEAVEKRGYKVTIGNDLYSDSIGDEEDDNTYIKMYKKNVDTIVNAYLETN